MSRFRGLSGKDRIKPHGKTAFLDVVGIGVDREIGDRIFGQVLFLGETLCVLLTAASGADFKKKKWPMRFSNYCLKIMNNILKPGSILIFDAFGDLEQEFAAFYDYTRSYYRNWELICAQQNSWLVAVQLQ